MILSWHRTFTGCTCRPIAALFYIWSAFHSRIFISHIIGSSYNIGSSKNILTYIFIWQSDIHWHFGSLCYIINSLDILYLYTMAIGSSNDDRIFIWHRIFFKWRSDLQMTIGYSFDIGSSSNDDWIFKWQSDIHLTCWFFNAAHPVDLHNARLRRMKKKSVQVKRRYFCSNFEDSTFKAYNLLQNQQSGFAYSNCPSASCCRDLPFGSGHDLISFAFNALWLSVDDSVCTKQLRHRGLELI